MTRTYTLVAENFGRGDTDALLARLGTSAVAVTATSRTATIRGTHRTIPGLRILMRGGTSGMRNTVAHSHACSTGFVAFCE